MGIKGSVGVFKNKDYFITYCAGIWVQVSGEFYPVDGREYDLGIRVLSAMEKSEKEIAGDDVNYWELLGYKGFASFAKKHEMVNIIKIDNVYKISYSKKDKGGRGGYVPDSTRCLELPLEATAKEMEEAIIKVFDWGEAEEVESENFCFETVNDSKVQYEFDYDPAYINMGDGHTDAYQIYAHEKYDKNYIGFMIDSGYDSYEREDIEDKWQQCYGVLRSYEYIENSRKEYYAQIIGRTDEVEIHSYLFRDGEDVMEIIFEIDLVKTPLDVGEKIKKDFISVVESVKIL